MEVFLFFLFTVLFFCLLVFFIMEFTRSCFCHFYVFMATCVTFTSALWNLKTWPARNSYPWGCVCPALHGPERELNTTTDLALVLEQDFVVYLTCSSSHHPYYQLTRLKTPSTHPETSMKSTWSITVKVYGFCKSLTASQCLSIWIKKTCSSKGVNFSFVFTL